jgi:hypothetical protein
MCMISRLTLPDAHHCATSKSSTTACPTGTQCPRNNYIILRCGPPLRPFCDRIPCTIIHRICLPQTPSPNPLLLFAYLQMTPPTYRAASTGPCVLPNITMRSPSRRRRSPDGLRLQVDEPGDEGMSLLTPEFMTPKGTMPITPRTMVTVPYTIQWMRAEQHYVDEAETYEVFLINVWGSHDEPCKAKVDDE